VGLDPVKFSVAGYSEYVNGTSDSIKGRKFLDKLSEIGSLKITIFD
jgi:hypothetical protein